MKKTKTFLGYYVNGGISKYQIGGGHQPGIEYSGDPQDEQELFSTSSTPTSTPYVSPNQKYIVRKGDTLSGLVKGTPVTIQDIVKRNPHLAGRVNRIIEGEEINLPIYLDADPNNTKNKSKTERVKPSGSKYTIKQGETLGEIAKKTGVPLETLIEANKDTITNPDKIQIGQTINLGGSPQRVNAPATHTQSPAAAPQSFQQAMRAKPAYKGRDQGQITAPIERSGFDRAAEILGNPLQSLADLAKYSELPAQGFSKVSKNAYDKTIGLVNPAYWVNAGLNAADFADKGEYKKAAVEALDALPALGKIKYITYLKNLPANELTQIPGAKQLLLDVSTKGMSKVIGGGTKQLGSSARLLTSGAQYQDGGVYRTSVEEITPQFVRPNQKQIGKGQVYPTTIYSMDAQLSPEDEKVFKDSEIRNRFSLPHLKKDPMFMKYQDGGIYPSGVQTGLTWEQAKQIDMMPDHDQATAYQKAQQHKTNGYSNPNVEDDAFMSLAPEEQHRYNEIGNNLSPNALQTIAPDKLHQAILQQVMDERMDRLNSKYQNGGLVMSDSLREAFNRATQK